MTAPHTIASEDDAFALLERILDGSPLGPEFDLRFEGWPRFVVTVQGADFDGTIPTRIMPTLLELQRQVHRLYAKTAHGTDEIRRLSKQERESLELVVRVERGSSWFDTLLNAPWAQTLQAAVGKMSSEQIVIVLLVSGVVVTCGWAWKQWLNSRAKERELDQQIQLSRLETERIATIARAVQRVPLAGEFIAGLEPMRQGLVRQLKPQDRLEIPPPPGPRDAETAPMAVTGADAESLTRPLRPQPTERLLSEDFLLRSADFSKPGVVRVELQRVADQSSFRADVPAGVLDNDQERALRDRSWERQTLPLSVLVNEVQGRYTSAKVVAVRGLSGAAADQEGT